MSKVFLHSLRSRKWLDLTRSSIYLDTTLFNRKLSGSGHAAQSVAALQEELGDYLSPPRLAGRPFLPGSQGSGMPQVVPSPRPDFPRVLNADELGYHKGLTMHEKGDRVSGRLQEMLLKHGALLIDADVGMSENAHINDFLKGMDWPVVSYTFGTGIRKQEGERVLSASDEPPEYSIEQHQEMAYTPGIKPAKIGFFCLKTSEFGGETVICDVRESWKQFDKKLLSKICERGIRYHWWDDHDDVPNPYRTWKEQINVSTREEAEVLLRKNNYGWEWMEEGLSSWVDRSAFANHPITGESLWFNQAVANHKTYFQSHPRFMDKELPARRYPATCFYPEWEEIEPEVLQHIRDVSWKCSVGFKLLPGQLLLLDNYYVQHARLGFQGNRKVFVTLMG